MTPVIKNVTTQNTTTDAPFKKLVSKGVSLLEAALAMAILAIVSISVSNVLLAGVTTHMSSKTRTYQVNVAMDVMDSLRNDIRFALAVTANPNTRLQIDLSGGRQVVYTFDNGTGTLTRTDTLPGPGNSTSRNFVSSVPSTVPIRVACINTCFSVARAQVFLEGLQVADGGPATSALDREFGSSNTTYRNIAFDIMTSTAFQ
jgi:Tfp pilus assembly protein PilV